MLPRTRAARVTDTAETAATTIAGPADRSVSNRSLAALLPSADRFGTVSDAPPVVSHLAEQQSLQQSEQQALAPEESAPPEPLVVVEDYQPEPGLAMTEDGVGVQVVVDEPAVASAPRSGFVDLGQAESGTGHGGHAHGEGECLPRAMVGVGRTGNVVWAGGGGAGPHGNEGVGSIQVSIPPVYQSTSNGWLSDSEAWVLPGTGLTIVLRSFVGSNAGDQGNGWWVTPAAAAKLDQHEQTHVEMTKLAYDLTLGPMESRLTERRSAYTQTDAISALKQHVDWEDTVKRFQTADDLWNFPMKVVDTVDLASGTYVVDTGAGTVAGTAFTHRLRVPSEPAPAP